MSKKEYAAYAGAGVFLVFADYLFMRQVNIVSALYPETTFIWILLKLIVLSVNGVVAYAYIADGFGFESQNVETLSSLMAKAKRTPSSDPYGMMAEDQKTIQTLAYLQEKGLVDIIAMAEGEANIKVLGNLKLTAKPTMKEEKVDLQKLVQKIVPPTRPMVERSLEH